LSKTFYDYELSKKLPPTVGLAAVPVFIELSARNRSPIEKLKLKLTTNAD